MSEEFAWESREFLRKLTIGRVRPQPCTILHTRCQTHARPASHLSMHACSCDRSPSRSCNLPLLSIEAPVSTVRGANNCGVSLLIRSKACPQHGMAQGLQHSPELWYAISRICTNCMCLSSYGPEDDLLPAAHWPILAFADQSFLLAT
jgi:hypothetical protein